MANIIWQPQPRQLEFMRRPEYEVLYGGAAGGGKSDAIVIEALRQVKIPYYKALILRKTFDQLRELIDKSLNYYPRIIPGAKYNGGSHTWTFPSGAKIIFGAMHDSRKKYSYQGQAFDAVFFDELTHFQQDEYDYLKSRNRPNGPGTRVYIRSTANPGGIGHGWVKARWIDAAPPMTPIDEEVNWTLPDGSMEQTTLRRIFVPSSVFDNQILMANDPLYVARLASMPQAERDALLYGDWTSFSGQVFREWKNLPEHYEDRQWTHVIDPFLVPADWPIYCGMDWGFSKPFSVSWYACSQNWYEGKPQTMLYKIREYYGCTGVPNQGVQMDPASVAREILRIERDDPNLRGKKITRIGDPAIWGSDGTESIGSLMERQGVYFERGNHGRIDGKMQIHYRLNFNEYGTPMFQVFNSCKHFLRTFPALVYDEKNTEDVDTSCEDHSYDELRYVCLRHFLPPPVKQAPEIELPDPLDLRKPKYSQYNIMRRI